MDYRKCSLIFSLILAVAISGCGKKAGEKQKGELLLKEEEELYTGEMRPQEEVPKFPLKEEIEAIEDVVGPVVKETPEMIEPEKKIILEEGEILVSDFESWPNNLGGEIGVYGALEPDWDTTAPRSWVYEPTTPGYDLKNVHNGRQSFRLVNGLGLKPDEAWGSFAMDLGPTTDLTVVPKRVESLDVSGYRYFTFWTKGEKGGEKMELLIRDANALNYMPQIKYKLPDATTEWQKIVVLLEQFKGQIDLTQLDNIGIGFGRDIGNMEGDIAYIDNFVFTNMP